MKYLLLLIFLFSLVSAVEVDFDCPDNIYVGEEFECSVEVSGGEGEYDVKVEIDKERNSVLKVWDGEYWKSGYYYVKGFVENGEKRDVRLKVLEAGRYEGVLKLRQGESVEFFDIKMRIEEDWEVEEEEVEEGEGGEIEEGEDEVIVLGGVDLDVISLNGDVVLEEDEEWDYVSKDGRIIDWLVYGFCLFLIFLLGVLIWDKF